MDRSLLQKSPISCNEDPNRSHPRPPIQNVWIVCNGKHVVVRCYNAGGGGIFPKVEGLFAKCIGTRKRSFRENSPSLLGCSKRINFPSDMFHSHKHVRIFAHFHKLLEYARIFGFAPVSGRWRSILRPFCIFETWYQTCHLLYCTFELHFPRRIFRAKKTIWQLWFPKCYKVFTEPPYTIVTPYVVAMRWLRLVGSLKWYVSSAEYHLFYRALLQKRHTILRSLLIVATPYTILTPYVVDSLLDRSLGQKSPISCNQAFESKPPQNTFPAHVNCTRWQHPVGSNTQHTATHCNTQYSTTLNGTWASLFYRVAKTHRIF